MNYRDLIFLCRIRMTLVKQKLLHGHDPPTMLWKNPIKKRHIIIKFTSPIIKKLNYTNQTRKLKLNKKGKRMIETNNNKDAQQLNYKGNLN